MKFFANLFLCTDIEKTAAYPLFAKNMKELKDKIALT